MAAASALVSFGGANGSGPTDHLIEDGAGDLFGVTIGGGTNNEGTVFEIANTATGYATTPTTLYNFTFTGFDGALPLGGLTTDAAGDLFGVTSSGGTNDDGLVFEIAKKATGYATAPTTLLNFSSTTGSPPASGLITDAAGNLFGTTAGGFGSAGSVFEITNTATGYASTATILAQINLNGGTPDGRLIMDAAGDLFGTTTGGTAGGSVFEIARTASGYAPLTTLAALNDFAVPVSGLAIDAAGDLFGTEVTGGTDTEGAIFEIARTASGYASTPTTLFNFGFNGVSYYGGYPNLQPAGGLVIDAAGDLFGLTNANGSSLFELAKTATGYASAPTLVTSTPSVTAPSPLLANAAGDLFGTSLNGGTGGRGAVFEITASGFATFSVADATTGSTTNGTGSSYTGPVVGLTSEFVLPTTDQVTITSGVPDVFIQVGVQGQQNPTIAGINVSAGNGNNVLDSYANSSFFTDGTGTDQNYLDARALTHNQWDTVANFHSGDNITLWGVTQADFNLDWIGDTQGATGYTGLTGVYVPTAANRPEAAVTLAGFKMADLTNGKLAITYDTINGTPYASIHAA